MSDELRRRRSTTYSGLVGHYSMVYADVITRLRSAGYSVRLVAPLLGGAFINVAGPSIAMVRLADLWEGLPLAQVEQAGWSISVANGHTLALVEDPSVGAALRLVERVAFQLTAISATA